jgi:hypothetical protein
VVIARPIVLGRKTIMRRRLAIPAATSLSLLAAVGAARAQSCSTSMLNGSYSASFHGETLGTLSGNPPILTPFTTPNQVNGVEIIQFDGAGTFQQLALSERNGLPAALGTPGLTDNGFQPQTGTYSVNSDCTGIGTISQPNMQFTFALVVGERGKVLRTIATSAHADEMPNNPNCTPPNGCDIAAQIATEGEKVFTKDN